MYKKCFLSVAAIAVLAVGVVGVTATAEAQQRIKWKLHSAWGSSVPHLGTLLSRSVYDCASVRLNREEPSGESRSFERQGTGRFLECIRSVF